MPIIIGDRPIFRIKLGDVEIREVRSGDELTWGLYEITYINKGPKQVETGYGGTSSNPKNIPDYVWGYPDYNPSNPELSGHNFYIYIPEDSTAAEALKVLKAGYGYRSHSEGWYEDNACLNYIPAITQDFRKDLDLFCKWRQRKYCFNGTYMYEKVDASTYEIYVYKKKNGAGGYEDGYYDRDYNSISIDGNIIKEEEIS